MTNMRRVSVPIPDDLDKAITKMRKKEEYSKYSYAKLVRLLLKHGLEKIDAPPS